MNNILETILKLILGVICSFFVFFGFIFCFDSPDTFTNIKGVKRNVDKTIKP